MQRLAGKKPETPDPLKLLQYRRWLTLEESEQMYLSTRLGRMRKEGFMFWYSGAPSEWPVSYLEAVIAHDMSVQMLNARWKHEADYGPAGADRIKLPALPDSEVTARQNNNRAMQAYFADLTRTQTRPKSLDDTGGGGGTGTTT